MSQFCPRLVSERFGKPPYIFCVEATGAMLAAKSRRNRKTASQVVMLDLWHRMGNPPHGSDNAHLADALRERYPQKHTPLPLFGGTGRQLATYLREHQTCGAAVTIDPRDLPAHERRWVPNLQTPHEVYVQATSPSGDANSTHVWVIDPMGLPLGKGRYRGEWWTTTVLHHAFLSALVLDPSDLPGSPA